MHLSCTNEQLTPVSGYPLGGTTASLAAFASRNFTVVFALILMASPVAGLRPIRAARWALTSLPSPGIVNSPSLRVCVVAV